MMSDHKESTTGTVDPDEVEKFSAMAAEWWDPDGKFRPLHALNPVRLAFIRDEACARFGRDPKSLHPLEGLTLLDIGCGGGLLAEPLTRLGAAVTGVDAAEKNIRTAEIHAEKQGLAIDYRHTRAETLAEEGRAFDIVLAMEVIEHVADVPLFLGTCADLLKPGGLIVLATINRTSKAYAFAIVGAERVLRWLPKGTHDYAKLVRPMEIRDALVGHGLKVRPPVGVSYRFFSGDWTLSRDTDVNYMMTATMAGSN